MADRVFINGRAAIHAGSSGKSIAFPDVCLCPPAPPAGPIPTPLPNTAKAADLQGGAATVTIEGNPIAHAKSFIATSTGNEVSQSTGGGVITHMVQGKAYFKGDYKGLRQLSWQGSFCEATRRTPQERRRISTLGSYRRRSRHLVLRIRGQGV